MDDHRFDDVDKRAGSANGGSAGQQAVVDPLPVRARVFDGEDVDSYAARLAAANCLTVYQIEHVLRPLGLLTSSTSPRHPDRLQAWRGLGGLHPTAFTTPVEVGRALVISRLLCLGCTHGVPAVGRHARAGWVCLRHRRWIGAEQHRLTDAPEVLRAERRFRGHLAPRGVLVDSLVMLLALKLALLAAPPGPAWHPSRGWEPDPAVYPSQVAWARTLTDPPFLTAIAHPVSAQARLDAVDHVTAHLSADPRWRVKTRLLRLGIGVGQLRPASDVSGAGLPNHADDPVALADVNEVALRLL